MVVDSLPESLRICRHCSLSNFFEPQRLTIRILHWPTGGQFLLFLSLIIILLCPVSFKLYCLRGAGLFLLPSRLLRLSMGRMKKKKMKKKKGYRVWFVSLFCWSCMVGLEGGCGWFFYLSYVGGFYFYLLLLRMILKYFLL